MRFLLDTNIFIYLATDIESIHDDVLSILSDYDNTLCISAETLRELIVAYRNKGFSTKRWKTCEALIQSIEVDYGIQVLPLRKEHYITYSKLQINEAEGHRDPSDHIIISQAITEQIPLISSDRRFQFYRTQQLDLVFNAK